MANSQKFGIGVTACVLCMVAALAISRSSIPEPFNGIFSLGLLLVSGLAAMLALIVFRHRHRVHNRTQTVRQQWEQ